MNANRARKLAGKATREAGGCAQMPVVPNAAVFTASPYDQADRNS